MCVRERENVYNIFFIGHILDFMMCAIHSYKMCLVMDNSLCCQILDIKGHFASIYHTCKC